MDEIQVDQDHWERATAPDWLTTEGLGPCIAVAILNHTQRKAWLSHYAGISATDATGLKEMINDATNTQHENDEVDIGLYGGDPAHCDTASVQADRDCAEALVRETFPTAEATWGSVDILEVIFEGDRWEISGPF
jgi:hypothetical protein